MMTEALTAIAQWAALTIGLALSASFAIGAVIVTVNWFMDRQERKDNEQFLRDLETIAEYSRRLHQMKREEAFFGKVDDET